MDYNLKVSIPYLFNFFQLFPTLYVGEHKYGLFAVPSLVDKQSMIAKNRHEPLLIEGRESVKDKPCY